MEDMARFVTVKVKRRKFLTLRFGAVVFMIDSDILKTVHSEFSKLYRPQDLDCFNLRSSLIIERNLEILPLHPLHMDMKTLNRLYVRKETSL
ncbi:hypothetical protein ABKN59_004734 [Abortiporus biennis]